MRSECHACVRPELVGEPHRAVRLNRAVERAKPDLHRIRLAHAEFLYRRRALIDQRGCVETHQVRGVQLSGRLGQRKRDALVVRDHVAECITRLRVFERRFDRRTTVPDRARGVVDTTERNSVQCRGEPIVEFADDLPWLDAQILAIASSASSPPDVAEQANDALYREPCAAGRHDECADTATLRRAAAALRDGEQHAVVRDRRVAVQILRPEIRQPSPSLTARVAIMLRSELAFGVRRVRNTSSACRPSTQEHLALRLVRQLREQPARPERPMRERIQHQPVVRLRTDETALPTRRSTRDDPSRRRRALRHAHLVVAGRRRTWS